MRVSLFIEHPVPRPWSETSELEVFQQSLDQLELADRMGFHAVWLTEHHFQEEYSHSSAPEVFLAALSQRTTNLRLGHGIMHLPPAINHPARAAERIAALDLVSRGRVEFGTGEASSMAELGGFHFDPGKKREMWREGLEVALRCLTEEPFTGFAGEHVTMPARNVVPKPLQGPHPPVWVACTRPATTELAARLGIGALSFSYLGAEACRPVIENYYRIMAEEGAPLTPAVNANVLITAGDVMVGPTHQEALDRVGLGIGFHGYGIRHYYVAGKHKPGRTSVWGNYERSLAGEETLDEKLTAETAGDTKRSDWQDLALRNAQKTSDAHAGVGTVDEVRAKLEAYEAAGVDELMLLIPPAKHEYIMESLTLLGEQVLPALRERDEANAAEREAKKAPIIEAALSRYRPNAPALDPDYWFGGVPKSWDGAKEASEIRDAMETAAKLKAEQR